MLVGLLTPTHPSRIYLGFRKEIIMTNEINTITTAATVVFEIKEEWADVPVHSRTEGLNAPGRVFYSCLEKIPESVPFDSGWSNGTGYYDGAVNAPVPVSKWVWSYDPITNRFIVLIGTRFGTVAIFERYTHGTSKAPVIVCNVPRKGYTIWQTAGLNSQLGERVLTHVLGDPEFSTIAPNIGMIVETLARLFLKSE